MAWIPASWQVEDCFANPFEPDRGPAWARLTNEQDFPGWKFTVRYRADWTTGGLEIDTGYGRDLTAKAHRKIPVGKIHDAGHDAIVEKYASEWRSVTEAMQAKAGMTRTAGVTLPAPSEFDPTFFTNIDMSKRGRRGVSDQELAGDAAKYVRCLSIDRQRAMRTLSEMTRQDEAVLRGRIGLARKRGILTETPPGKAGGELTPKGWSLLNGQGPAWLGATPEQRGQAAYRDARFAQVRHRLSAGTITPQEATQQLAGLLEE